MTPVSIAFRVNTDSQQQHFSATTDIDDVSGPSPSQLCYRGCGRPARLQNRWRVSWCCDLCEDDGSHDDGYTDRSHNDKFEQVGGFGSRWRSNVGNDSNDIPPSVSTDTQGSSSAQADAKMECCLSITSSNSTPPVLPAMLNPSLKLPARQRPSMAMCDTTDLSNDDNDLKRRHVEFGGVYSVGETSVAAQGTHTRHGNGSVTYPSESIESLHEPTPSLPPPTPRSLTKKEQQRSRSHREANKGSYGQAMRRVAPLHAPGRRPHRPLPERTPEEQRTEPQEGGSGSCEGDDRPKPAIDRRTIISCNLFCRSVGCHRQATTVDGRCCYRCVNSNEPAAMDGARPHDGRCFSGMPCDDVAYAHT